MTDSCGWTFHLPYFTIPHLGIGRHNCALVKGKIIHHTASRRVKEQLERMGIFPLQFVPPGTPKPATEKEIGDIELALKRKYYGDKAIVRFIALRRFLKANEIRYPNDSKFKDLMHLVLNWVKKSDENCAIWDRFINESTRSVDVDAVEDTGLDSSQPSGS